MSAQTSVPKSGGIRQKIGWSVTGLWITLFAAYLFYFGLGKFIELPPNELGDTFAGWFAPLALFWVVLGYLQQGDELKLNTRALMLQQKELQEQSKTFKDQMEALTRQAQATEQHVKLMQTEFEGAQARERQEIKPRFIPIGSMRSDGIVQINVENRGGDAFDVLIDGPDNLEMSSTRRYIPRGESTGIRILGEWKICNFKIRCRNLRQEEIEQEYVLYLPNSFVEKESYDPEIHHAN